MRTTKAMDLASAAGAQLFGNGEARVQGVTVDSRNVQPGDLFVALAGERHDGHDFIENAFRSGAAAVLAERKTAVPHDRALLLANDSLKALGRLGSWQLERNQTRVVGVTGSVGKTSTREWIATVLSSVYRVLPGRGNYNTAIGLPLVLHDLDGEEWAVLEYGMRGLGEITELGDIAPPEVAVLTRIGESHLGRLGSMEAIARAKGELLEALLPGGTAVLNAADPWQRWLAAEIGRKRNDVRWLWYGDGEGSSFRAQTLLVDGEGSRVTLSTPNDPELDGRELYLPVTGRHQVENALAAMAVATSLQVPSADWMEALSTFQLPPMRGVRKQLGSFVMIDDSYNASPASVEAALNELAERSPGRRIAVLGSMLELGDTSPDLHRRIGEKAKACGVSLLIAVGEEAVHMLDPWRSASDTMVDNALHAEDAEAAWALLKPRLQAGDTVLVKGSRGIGLDRLVEWMETSCSAGEEVPPR